MKNSVKASSLTETIVAALILLITFMVTMETLGRLMVRRGAKGGRSFVSLPYSNVAG